MVVRCPQCGGQFKVPDTAVGKRGRCKHCQHVFELTASNQDATADARADAAAEVDGEADGEPMMYAAVEPPESGGVLDALLQAEETGVEEPAEVIAAGRRAAVAAQDAAAGGPATGVVAARKATGGGFSLGAYRRPLVIGGGVVVGLVGLYLLWTFVISGYLWPSVAGWAAPYVTKDVTAIAYADVQKIRGEKVWSDLKSAIGRDLPRGPGAGLKPDDVSAQMTLYFGERGSRGEVHLFRTTSARALDDVAGSKEKSSSHQNVEYKRAGGNVCAKLSDRVFCVVGSEDELKMFLDGSNGKARGMNAEVSDAFSHVGKGDLYMAGRPPSGFMHTGEGSTGGFGITFHGDSVKVTGIIAYKDADGAKKSAKDFEDEMARMKEQMKSAPAVMKDRMSKVVTTLEGFHVKQSGKYVIFDVDWTVEQFRSTFGVGLALGG